MNWKHLILSSAMLTLLAACSSTKPADTTAGTANQTGSVQPPPYYPEANGSGSGGSGAGLSGNNVLNDPNSPLAKRSVYFAYDTFAVDTKGQPVVSNHSNYLKQNPNTQIIVQGNTDSRGSREYNLALGQRRAEAVKRAMLVLGVKESQVEAVSFGKEKPRALGNNETDHAENRRADIVYPGQ